MMEVKDIEFENDVIVVKMEVNQLPTYSIDQFGEIIKWGNTNQFPKTAINIYNNHPEHKAIVDGKARYLSGSKIIASQDLPLVNNFLLRANRYESWHSLRKKCEGDIPLYGGFACQINPNLLGRPVEWFHLDMGKLRACKSMRGMWYSDEWEKSGNNIKKTFLPFYTNGIREQSVYFYKDHTPSINKLDGIYPVADYSAAMLDIETDIEISNFFHSLVQNGFSAGHIITFFNGKLTSEKKREIEQRFQAKHQGSDNAGKVVLVFTNPGSQGTQVTNITPNGLAEQYESLNKRIENKIVRAHNVPRALFKLEIEGSLGDRTVIDLQHELFINEYAIIKQVPFNDFTKKMCAANTGVQSDFYVEQVKTIGKELPLDNQNVINALNARDPNIVTNYIIKMYGLEIPVAEISQEAPAVKQIQEGANDSLKGLTGRQRGALDTIARKFNKKVITEQQAILQLMPFGFSESDAKLYLGIEANALQVQQSNQDKFLEWVKLNTVEIDENDEILEEKPVNFQLKDDDLIEPKNNPELPKKKSFIQGLIDSFRDKDKDKSQYDTEIYTVYKYGLRPELKAKGEPVLLETSHDFCIKMIEATSGNKRFTFESIDKMDNDFGENAWDYRGGFTGKKHTCRHLWIGETRIRKTPK